MVVNFKKVKLFAVTRVDGTNFYVGSNGNLIRTQDSKIDLPMIFGDFDSEEFLKLKSLIDESFFDFYEIKNLYFYKSKRWDIETKDGLLLKLPSKNLNKSFQIFIKIINENKLENIKMIDLRQNNQVITNG